jgi:type II secretory pathway pseudopilin PulG
MHLSDTKSFTLVELLVAIGILAILTAAVVIVLNPAELLKQSRDSKRTTDLANLNNAVKLLLTQNPDVSLGSASTVYVSLADSSSTCGSYSLPPLPAGWKYQCATQANYQKADGSGWVPVNFAAAGSIASLSALPVDPQNSAPSGLYYTYVPGGSWALTALMESEKGSKAAIEDGGMLPGVLERGTDISLTPSLRDRGLIGYWSLDEGTGATAYDVSGNGNAGALISSPAWQGEGSCKRGGCLSFDGVDDFVRVQPSPIFNFSNFTISAWVKPAAFTSSYRSGIVSRRPGSGWNFDISGAIEGDGQGKAELMEAGGAKIAGGTVMQAGQWYYAAVAVSGNSVRVYVNGVLDGSGTLAWTNGANDIIYIGGVQASSGYYLNGLMDDVRVYNRALSDAEIQSIYNATK